MVAGVVYCSVIGACHEVFDCAGRRNGRRARRLVRRASRHGALPWPVPRATIGADAAARRVAGGDRGGAAGLRAHGRIGRPADAGAAQLSARRELHRLRGEFEQGGRGVPARQPGRPRAGSRAWRCCASRRIVRTRRRRRSAARLNEPHGPRVHVARAAGRRAEILLAAGERGGRRAAAADLAELARATDAPFLAAAAAQAAGAVSLAGGDADAAVAPLRQAATGLAGDRRAVRARLRCAP